MELVDEEHHVLGAADFVHDGLDALLELAAVLGPGDHHRQVEHHEALVLEDLRNIARDDALGEPFDDRGLADAGLAEKDGVVLGAAAEDLHETFDLGGAADDGVEGAFLGEFGQVATEGIERRGLALALGAGGGSGPGAGRGGGAREAGGFAAALLALILACAEKVEHFFADFLELEPEVHEDLSGDAVVLAEEPEEEVLGADVVVVEVPGFLDGVLDDLFGAGGLGQLAHGDHFRAWLDELLDLEADLAEVDVEVLEDVGADARALFDEPEQDVLGPDVLVVEALGLLVGQGHHFAGTVCEALEHG